MLLTFMKQFKFLRRYLWISMLVLVLQCHLIYCEEPEEDVYTSMDPKIREPSPCEICKYFAREFQRRLDESAKSKEVLETGHGLDLKKKKFKYVTSEMRFIEALQDPHICERIMDYNIHAERKGSLRYEKGRSETMSTLHNLVDKGVKVELGIPYELWDTPSAEISKMQRKCFLLAERYENVIEDWYYRHQDLNLYNYLCHDRYLKDENWEDTTCLDEFAESDLPSESKKKSLKGDTGVPSHSKPLASAEGKSQPQKESPDTKNIEL